MCPNLLVGLALAVAAPAAKDAKKDPPSVVGTWVAETMVRGGKDRPAAPGDEIAFTLTADGKFTTVAGGGAKSDEGTYKIDPKKDPPHIDIVPGDGGGMVTLRGIYKVAGDTLTLCLHVGKDTDERPAKFESPAGSRVILMTLKRLAKKD